MVVGFRKIKTRTVTGCVLDTVGIAVIKATYGGVGQTAIRSPLFCSEGIDSGQTKMAMRGQIAFIPMPKKGPLGVVTGPKTTG